jgi:REP element-mobilizing transposase RayT
LPHFDGGPIPQFITFRLGDSMPKTVIDRWRKELEREAAHNIDSLLRCRIENYLDQGYGACYLKDNRVANVIEDSLLYYDEKCYKLTSWVVMPNHVHVLLTPTVGEELSSILHSIKSYTAHRANEILDRSGQFWQEECFDRFIRNSKHFQSVVSYIENNPVKARLCKKASDWRYSSAWGRT